MNAPEPCFQVNQLTPDPAVKFDRELADQYLLYAHRLAARGQSGEVSLVRSLG